MSAAATTCNTTTGGGNGDASREVAASTAVILTHPPVATTGNGNTCVAMTEVINHNATAINTLQETSVAIAPISGVNIFLGEGHTCVALTSSNSGWVGAIATDVS